MEQFVTKGKGLWGGNAGYTPPLPNCLHNSENALSEKLSYTSI